MALYGYQEIRTPAFEATELFRRGVGEGTDIVNKEMYTFTDLGGKELTLCPELTAPVIRAYIENNMGAVTPISRLYYIDSLFRQERPQKGRLRQFHQFGAEAIGSPYPEQDVEIIALAFELCVSFAVGKVRVRLNTLGSPAHRGTYLEDLRGALTRYGDQLSELDRYRLENNPLRIFDSKDTHTQKIVAQYAPPLWDYISNEDREHFQSVRNGLEALKIPFEQDPSLVRGLDYYTRTTFEITSERLGAQDAICGGGRYDDLVEELGGKSVPAVGFATGIERLLLAAHERPKEVPLRQPLDIFLVFEPEPASATAIRLAQRLRQNGYSVVMETLRRSIKAQFREANRLGAHWTLILGGKEMAAGRVEIKEMLTGTQKTVSLESIFSSSRGYKQILKSFSL